MRDILLSIAQFVLDAVDATSYMCRHAYGLTRTVIVKVFRRPCI
jgi:hypothetical protein